MTDAAFREALEAYGVACANEGDRGGGATFHYIRVLALYAERQGEEAVVTDGTPDGQYIELRFVQSTRITDGDRVWVVKVEEGT